MTSSATDVSSGRRVSGRVVCDGGRSSMSWDVSVVCGGIGASRMGASKLGPASGRSSMSLDVSVVCGGVGTS